MIRDATPTKGGIGGFHPPPAHSAPFSFIFLCRWREKGGIGGLRPPPVHSPPIFFPFPIKMEGKGGIGGLRPPPAHFPPLYILEPNKGDSHLIQDDTPHIGYDRLGWLGWLATWSGIPPLICVEPDMGNGQWIRDAILILDRTR